MNRLPRKREEQSVQVSIDAVTGHYLVGSYAMLRQKFPYIIKTAIHNVMFRVEFIWKNVMIKIKN